MINATSLSPQLLAYESYGQTCQLTEAGGPCYAGNVGLLLTVGFLVNGPYALITTAVSADLVRGKKDTFDLAGYSGYF